MDVMKRYNALMTISILGTLLMALSLYEVVGLIRTILYSLGITVVFGCAEAIVIFKQIRGDSMHKKREPILTIYFILMVIGGAFAVASFIGELSIMQNIMFGIGFGLIMFSLFSVVKKGNS